MAEKKIKITQVRSVIDRIEPQKRTIRALGLGRPGHSVVKKDTAQVRGMIRKVNHLVAVEDVK
ncbi:MAG: rpmD [candidate division NC10 bacterium]|jgi:large subunit ribosomal protein L30|nr:rpmD [candidate division NC10 bacterium]